MKLDVGNVPFKNENVSPRKMVETDSFVTLKKGWGTYRRRESEEWMAREWGSLATPARWAEWDPPVQYRGMPAHRGNMTDPETELAS